MKGIEQKRLLNDIKMTLEFLIDRIDKVSEPDQEKTKTESKEWQPKTGDIVTVWDDDEGINQQLFYLCTLPNSQSPYCCVDTINVFGRDNINDVWRFENMSKPESKKLTLSEIEDKLGYEIEIIE